MIRSKNLSFSIGERVLFANVNFDLASGWTALVGPNGAGKSVLARCLSGQLEPSSGVVRREGPVALVPQSENRPEGPVQPWLDELWLSSSESLPFLHSLCGDLDGDRLFQELSGGEWLRLRLARILAGDPAVLILDEPTNHLDAEGRRRLFAFLESWRGVGLLISHDRSCLSVAERVMELAGGRLRSFDLTFEDYREQARLERERWEENLIDAKRERKKTEREQRQALDRQEKRMRRGAKAAEKGGMPAILLGLRKRNAQKTLARTHVRTQEKVDLADRDLESLWLSGLPEVRLRLDPEAVRPGPGELLVHGEGLLLTGGGRALWREPLGMTLRGPGRWAIVGGNGSGKSSLLRAIAGDRGARERFRGVLRSSVTQALLDQETMVVAGTTLIDWVREARPESETDLRNRLADFAFTGESVFREVTSLSGGERMRASLARVFLRPTPPKLLLLDEPTNDLDLVHVEVLERMLASYEGALIVVSHDEAFREALNLEALVDLDSIRA